ncbi:WD40 repeat domain-containing protein [Candidatus Protofrankia datiscae]|uniref:WD40 repeat-containing protein n=1 Tax=Candidatus Protofrankia datiscae TaxID=2716812 RepID=F8AUT1_9ACTN|nr:WD40 repeat-containing protein [Candidatus Protofrankia datiscae]AEH08125.1 WD40 repeat-containing protein [Candidatus Protofrankia datiscae]
MLGGIVSFDLFGYESTAARRYLLHNINTAMGGRAKPTVEPIFPVSGAAPADSSGKLIPPKRRSGSLPMPIFPDSTATGPKFTARSNPFVPAARQPIHRPHEPVTLTTLTDHTDAVLGVTFAPKGPILATTSRDGKVRLWDVTDPARPSHLTTFTDRTHAVDGVVFAPGGAVLATISVDGTTRLWDIADPAQHHRFAALTSHTDAVFGAAFAPNGTTLATASADRTVRIWAIP